MFRFRERKKILNKMTQFLIIGYVLKMQVCIISLGEKKNFFVIKKAIIPRVYCENIGAKTSHDENIARCKHRTLKTPYCENITRRDIETLHERLNITKLILFFNFNFI